MAETMLYMSVSLDGLITGPDDGMDHPLGVDGRRLHDWLAAGDAEGPALRLPPDAPSAKVFGELMATGAVGDQTSIQS
jgi:hypothetical protein